MTCVGEGKSPPTLRLYQWIEPTISLGYFQKFADFEALPSPLPQLAVVRRPTGGGAILHDLELTYSIALRTNHPLIASDCCPDGMRDFRKLYKAAHDAITLALRELNIESSPCGFTDDSGPARGPFFCFARRHEFDLLVGDEKITGSAQRRTRHAVLQHGSIILADRFGQPMRHGIDPPITHSTQSAPADYMDRVNRLRQTLPIAFAQMINMPCHNGVWSADELALTPEIQSKYAGDEWMRRT